MILKTTLLGVSIAAGVLLAQAPSISKEAMQGYTGIKTNMTKLAEKVPEAVYGYKPVDSIRTLGALIGHVADAQLGTCSAVNGEAKPGTASKMTAKADLVAALKASFDECDKAFASLTDTNLTDPIKTRRGERSRLGALMGIIVHSNEEYGYMSVYLRMKEIVPPSSEK
jgi:hypothetical protein